MELANLYISHLFNDTHRSSQIDGESVQINADIQHRFANITVQVYDGVTELLYVCRQQLICVCYPVIQIRYLVIRESSGKVMFICDFMLARQKCRVKG